MDLKEQMPIPQCVAQSVSLSNVGSDLHITCPISLPLLGLCWCCQEVCPVGPDAFFGLGEHDESTNFASSVPDNG